MDWDKMTTGEEWRRFLEEKLAMEEQSKKKDTQIRELRSELELKEIQIKHLTQELDEANKERFDLKKKFIETSDSLKISEAQLNLSTKKRKVLHDEVNTKRDTMVNEHVMYQSAIIELKSVKKGLEKSRTRERELSRELEMWQTKYKLYSLYNEHIDGNENTINYEMEVIKRGIDALKTEESHVSDLKDDCKLVKKFIEALVLSAANYNLLDMHKEFYQNNFLDLKIKYKTLMEMVENYKTFQSPLLMKGIMKQWTGDLNHFRKINKKSCDFLSQIIKNYTREESLNASLIGQIEELDKISFLAKNDKEVNMQMDDIIRQLLWNSTSDSHNNVIEQVDAIDMGPSHQEQLYRKFVEFQENRRLAKKDPKKVFALQAQSLGDECNNMEIPELVGNITTKYVAALTETVTEIGCIPTEVTNMSKPPKDIATDDLKSNVTTFVVNKDTGILENDTGHPDNVKPNQVADVSEKAEVAKDFADNEGLMEGMNPDDCKLVEICKAFENVKAIDFELKKQLENENANPNIPN